MSSLESIMMELKALPPAQLEQAASYIRRLRRTVQPEPVSAFRQTAGTITPEEADEWLRAIEDCEHVDRSSW